MVSKYLGGGLSALLLLFLLCTCDRAQEAGDDQEIGTVVNNNNTVQDDHADEDHDDHGGEEGIHLTTLQLETMDIGFGDFVNLKINDFVSATGTLDLPPNGYADVSARARGFVRNARNYVEGNYVKKGAVLGYLENPDFIDHQQHYLEVIAELTFLRQELERQEVLLAAEAGILKNVQRLRSEVAAKTAQLAGIKQRLEYLGIRTAGLLPDNITNRITLFAPRAGYITSIAMHEGMYVEPNIKLMELIDESHFHLELDVFERDVAKISKGQRLTYTIPSLGPERYEATVHVIGKEFNETNKTVRIHAHPTGRQPPFVRGRFVEARIFLTDQTVRALPEAAVLRDGESAYIFVAPAENDGDEVAFERLRVNPGITDGGYTAVRLIDPLPETMRIVTRGAYFVYAQSQAGELEHEH
ncbi:efflux RND transporter periplasmic adaptor subunit [Neolewinella antarctica]|uniref:Cobalt-zinc-cadmium efflux system membrane fusion protein n=1 Tax=Neolewinella antarctica TaxID=442734 RepID=A0ABX0XGL9_9BACT|nr:efflux RND transporter periplasmic adaptor subunit [Neolewinella antarctica]NJC28342.1 cobalt-zinc-cadmium efflux system membrane fusion protein [Neolewinella antarctica]